MQNSLFPIIPSENSTPWLLGDALNELASKDSWWSRIIAHQDIALCAGADEVRAHLGGNRFLQARLTAGRVECLIPEEYLSVAHPGYRMMLDEDGCSEAAPRIHSLHELGRKFDLVRRKVLHETDRRRAILDRLWLRHACILGVDICLKEASVDLLAVKPDGTCVLFILRRYHEPDLLLAGNGGVANKMKSVEMQIDTCMLREIRNLLQRHRTLVHRQQHRFSRMADPLRIWPTVRLLVVDFDNSQRQLGVPEFRKAFADRVGRKDNVHDVITIGDPGNVSLKALFSGT